MRDYTVLQAGDTALVVEFGESIDRRLSARVLALARRLDEARLDGLVETVPTFRSLMVYYDPLLLPVASLVAYIERSMRSPRIADEVGRQWCLPACYDSRIAPDLDHIAVRTGLSPAQVIERHSSVIYHVYMLGFLPGQPYLGDLPAELALSRRETPRARIPAGSLAIAGTMTCIFPLETPCGWHLVGRSPVPLWQRRTVGDVLLTPGDKVSFSPISLREYERLSARAHEGTLQIEPVGVTTEAAA
jgi:inhibitor of KinA